MVVELSDDLAHPQQKREIKINSEQNLQFVEIAKKIRNSINLKKNQTLTYVVLGGIVLNMQDMIGDIYNKYKNDDGFLYV